MFTCIILAAGLSTRFGQPKALAQIYTQPAITCILNKALSSNSDEIIVVLGAHQQLIEPHVLNHKRIQIVYNKDYLLGQTSSYQAALKQASVQSQGFLLWPVDCPFIQTETINQLIKNSKTSNALISLPTYLGRRGHPPLFNASLRNELLHLLPSTGINSLYQKYATMIECVPINDPGITQTFNTPEELNALLK